METLFDGTVASAPGDWMVPRRRFGACRNGSWPCGDIHCILFFLVLINYHPCLCLMLFPGMGVVEMAAYIGQSEGGLG